MRTVSEKGLFIPEKGARYEQIAYLSHIRDTSIIRVWELFPWRSATIW